MAYAFKASLTVNSSQVTGTLTNFPALVSGTWDGTGGEADLRLDDNGGHIKNSDTSGTPNPRPADFAFFSDVNLTVPLKFEIELWNAATGQLIAWVKVPSIATSTVIYMGYGDVAVTSSQDDRTNVWDSNFHAVLHLRDGSTVSYVNAMGGSNFQLGGGTVSAIAGQVDGGARTQNSISGTNLYVSNAAGDYDYTSEAFTVEGWFKLGSLDSAPTLGGVVLGGNVDYTAGGYWVQVTTAGAINLITDQSGTTQTTASADSVVSTGTWYHLAATRSGSVGKVYKNGVDVTNTSGTHINPTASSAFWKVGALQITGTVYAAADQYSDEVRISAEARTAEWLLATYKTTNDNAAFWASGTESGGSGPSRPGGSSLTLTGAQ
jgi:hypothetical protein